MSSKRLPKWKMPNVSKTYYLACFNHILMAPRAFKICFFPSQFPSRLLWPPFGHQGNVKKRLREHLEALLWISGSPLAPQGLPRSLQKVTKNHQKSLLGRLGVPRAPKGPKLVSKWCQNASQNGSRRGHLGYFLARLQFINPLKS